MSPRGFTAGSLGEAFRRLIGRPPALQARPRTDVQRLVEELEAQVNNGGFDQFFFNSAGNESEPTIRALEAIGAIRTAAIVRRACARFPGGMPPADWSARQELLERVSPDSEAFEEEDAEFYEYNEDLAALVAAHDAGTGKS